MNRNSISCLFTRLFMLIFMILSTIIIFLSCSKEDGNLITPSYSTVTDIDGNTYQTIKIGNQWWMAENLKVTHYRNGDLIPEVADNTDWENLGLGAYCVYDNNEENVFNYGRLYNWFAVNDNRGLSPSGWHIPSDEEWKTLELYLGISKSEVDDIGARGTNEGGKLKEADTTHWHSPNIGATNEIGFSALPCGYRAYNGIFGALGGFTSFWTSTERYPKSAFDRILRSNESVINRYSDDKEFGFSVRCVKD